MSAKTKISDKCPSCKKKWVNHMGTIHVCRQLQEARVIIRDLLVKTPDAVTKAEQFISGKL